MIRECVWCQHEFNAPDNSQKFCNRECFELYNNEGASELVNVRKDNELIRKELGSLRRQFSYAWTVKGAVKHLMRVIRHHFDKSQNWRGRQ